jgi:hypothetical protein
MDPPFVKDLRSDLEGRLSAITEEAKTIRRMLSALEPPRPRRSRDSQDPAELILRELRDAPGSRASLLALSLGRDVDDVQAVLRRLEAGRAVERDGLGWRAIRSA